MFKKALFAIALGLSLPLVSLKAAGYKDVKNIHLIDYEKDSGFAIYRYGGPDKKGVEGLCALGVDEVMVLSGDASDHEYKYQEACPNLKVIYNYKQSANIPLTVDFLNFFDQWVADAKANGKKIAFRCSCGCHRTGRLAAYYQMKYQKLVDADAIAIMLKHGKYMFLHPQLKPQVRALKDYLLGKPCEEEKKHCVIQ